MLQLPYTMLSSSSMRGTYLSRQSAHDGQRGHVKGNPSTSRELGLVNLCPAAHNISGPTAGFDNDCRKQMC